MQSARGTPVEREANIVPKKLGGRVFITHYDYCTYDLASIFWLLFSSVTA